MNDRAEFRVDFLSEPGYVGGDRVETSFGVLKFFWFLLFSPLSNAVSQKQPHLVDLE